MTILWIIIFSIIYYLFVIKDVIKEKKKLFKIMMKNFFKLIFYALIGFIAAGVSSNIMDGNKKFNPVIIYIVLIFICEGVTLLIIRKDKIKLKHSVISTLMMMAIIIYSLY